MAFINTKKTLNSICPTFVDTRNPKYLTINEYFAACVFVNNFSAEMDGGFLDGLISSDVDFEISMFYEKKNSYETLKELTSYISSTGANIKTSSKNQLDIDIMNESYENAKYIKKKMQVDNDDLYYLNIYILTFSKDLKSLEENLQRIESIALSCGLSTRRGFFREESLFKACLPILYNPKDIKNVSRRNVLTSGLVSTYPFISNDFCDEKGVLIGTNAFNNSIVMLDRFDTTKYKNANMCVFGASGSGKSYFMKLMIARNRLLNITQFVIDPDREYVELCKALNGAFINFGKGDIINVFDIREISLDEDENFLQNKLQKLMTFFSIIFPNLNDEEKNLLEDKIIKCYAEKGITFDNESLYIKSENSKFLNNKKFKSAEMMPVLGDLYDMVLKDENMKKFAVLLKPYVSGSLKFMNNYTNVNLNNKLIVSDICNIDEKNLPMFLFVITDLYWDNICANRGRKKIIYLDEVWKLINHNSMTAMFVFKIFKTIRKYGGAATAITQDVNDFFALEDGAYGKGILNNSAIKCIFQVEETDVLKLKEVLNLSEMESYKLLNAERGSCLMYAGKNHILIKVKASEYEHGFISTDRKDL